MPAETGSELAVTLETFIAGMNSFRIYFSTRYTEEVTRLLAVQKLYRWAYGSVSRLYPTLSLLVIR
jgi:hypothetical protein